MDLTIINSHLNDRRVSMLADAVSNLETAIASGAVKNALFVDVKDTINRAVDEAERAYSQATRFYGDVLVMGAYNLPAALKEATKKKMADRAAFISAMIPLNDLLQAAKPLIVKRVPGQKAPPTPAQMAREAATMTCQCCARRYLANTGTMAHHGYQRPGGGWQTASCYGAKYLPFEASRDALGEMIISLKEYCYRLHIARREMFEEEHALSIQYTDYSKPRVWNSRTRNNEHPTVTVSFVRETFDAEMEAHKVGLTRYGNTIRTFDEIKANDLAQRDGQIARVEMDIRESKKRFDGWKQTHKWDNVAKVWEAING